MILWLKHRPGTEEIWAEARPQLKTSENNSEYLHQAPRNRGNPI